MSIECPHCRHVVKLKGVRPGRFALKCPKCAGSFVLTVPPDSGGKMTVAPVKPAASSSAPKVKDARSAATEATGAWHETNQKSAPPTEATGVWSGESAASPDATTAPAEESVRSVAPTRPSTRARARKTEDMPESLGGYEILKQLGQGGMGTVYLARQMSLDRQVALKVMNPRWAEDPRFLSRFTREAYAAAQLVHHNVVQIYDIGDEDGRPYFSMEFVSGRNLNELVRDKGKLDPEAAVGYILQAARGLKFAHDKGMIHRDVKPDNLMINDHGIVKVADLGLVKTPGSVEAEEAETTGASAPTAADVTAAGVAMGTPAYMAPEQGRNAAGVDARADIYSLGCTLYVLLTGRPPFAGKTAMEVITKHFTEPVIRPETIVKRVPVEVSDILVKMMAKKPEERYANLDAVIHDLEHYLGVSSAGPYSPREEHANTLEEAALAFHAAPARRIRRGLVLGFFAGSIGLALLCGLLGFIQTAAGLLGLGILTVGCSFILSGVLNHTYLFDKTRELIFDSSWSDWLMAVAGVVLAAGLLFLTGFIWMFLLVMLAAAGLAVLFYFAVDRRLSAQRREPLDKAERLLKTLRLRGVDEEALRQFVCKYSGQRWEEFYEALFGYEALLQARQLWGGTGERRRPRHAAWRDPLVRWIDGRRQARKEAREKKHLQKVEQKGLEARGLSAAEARMQARQAAEVLVDQAAAFKAEMARRASMETTAGAAGSMGSQALLRQMMQSPLRPTSAAASTRSRGFHPLRGLFRLVLGPKTRFLFGAVLVGVCLLWVQQNKLLSSRELRGLAEEALEQKQARGWALFQDRLAAAAPLRLPLLPPDVAMSLFNAFNPGVAGLLLMLSVFAGTIRTVFLFLAGALVMFLGPLVSLPLELPLDPRHIWLLGGLALALLGMVLSRILR